MAGKLTFSPEDFQQAAIQYRKELLMLPIIGCQESLKFMTARPGIRYKERVGTIAGDAQFAPYNTQKSQDFNLKVDYRELETFFGSVVAKFEPNSAISTILGLGATKGDGLMSTPTARAVLDLIAKGLSKHLNNAIWNGKRNQVGTTTKDLFNGFDTITDEEIKASNLSADKGNYLKLTEAITAANAVDTAKKILYALDPILRGQDCYMYCSQDFVDKYNEGYLLSHGATPYNTQYGQTAVEGSNGKLVFVPMTNKAGSKYIHITTKDNMLVGYDQMGDLENVMVKEYEPFILTYIATMFFGVQFESLDKSRLFTVELFTK